MAKYKYTYQDWVEGDVEFLGFGRVSHLGKTYLLYETISEDLGRISTEQHKAFLYYLDTAFEALKHYFILDYNESVLKDDFLEDFISGYKLILDTIKSEHEIITTRALSPGVDGRFELTKSEVDIYLSTKVDSEEMQIFAFGFMSDIKDAGIEFDKEEKAPLMYILRSNFYNWLVWFKRQQELKNIEPSLKIDSDKVPNIIAKLIGNSKSYTWLSNPDTELPKLHQLLKDKTLIHPDTTLEQFKTVFTAQPLQEVQPIEWIGAKNLLAYSLDCIYSRKIPTNTKLWSIAEKCFVDAKSLAQSKTNYENTKGGTPKQSDVIDGILKAL